MKRNIFKALAVVAALALSSCSMFITVEKGDNSTESKETYITIGLNQAARTALPTVSSENDFTSFTLTSKESIGSRLLGTWTSDDTSSAYAKMNAAKIAVTAGSTYTFTLQAVKGGAKWEGSVTKTIETGENSLSFTLAVASLSTEGTGAINVTLTVPDKVKVVDVELKTMDESQTVAPTDAALTFADGKAAYTASDIPAGNYVLVYTLYGDTQKTLKLGEWREYAGIADGLTSSSNPVIENDADLAQIYKITLNLNGGTFTGTFPGSYTRYSFDEDNEISLPYSAIRSDYISLNEDGEVELYKKNCFFEGWYDAETDGEIVYCIEPSMGDVTLWAYWTDTLTLDRIDAVYKNRGIDALKNYLNLQPLLEKGFDHINLKLTNMADGITPHSNGYDDWTDERFTAIVGAISSVPDFSVNLDLSETSLTFIPCSAFFDNSKLKNLTGITLPKTLTEIIQNAFANTSFTKITIPANVEEIGRFAFEDSELEEITFEKDSELESISLKAFYGSKITSITLPASLMIIHDSAFEACDKLETINYEGTAEMWAQIYRSADWHKNVKATTVTCSDGVVSLDYDGSITIASDILNGTVTASKTNATAGETITLTATPADGYEFGSFTVKNGTADVTVTNGTFTMPAGNVTVSATFIFKREQIEGKIGIYGTPYLVGDIVFSDGSAVPYSEGLSLSEAQKSAAIAVIFYKGTGLNSDTFTVDDNNNMTVTASDNTTVRTLGVGLHNTQGESTKKVSWATDSASGCTRNYKELQCTPSVRGSGAAETATFTGDFDGSDNWTKMYESANAANYPAFNWVNNYAATNSLTGGDYAAGWYLPTVAELSMMYRMKATVNAALEKAGGTIIAEKYYWSSSQYASNGTLVWVLGFTNGYLTYDAKRNVSSVCAIREF